MKTILALLILAAASTACQHQAPPTVATKSATVVATIAAREVDSESAPILPDSLALVLLRQYDPGPFLKALYPDQQGKSVQPMNGFFGPSFYHIEVVLTSVQRDPQQPGLYVVQGKDRYKGIITPLAGFVRFVRVRVDTVHAIGFGGKQVIDTSYSFLGTYELREEVTHPGAGTFRGNVVVQASPDDEGRLFSESVSDSLSRGGMVLFDGTWTSQATNKPKAATWVGDLFHYRGPQIASDFFIGGREPDINPKYAHLGWNTYWANDEWWADSPKLSL